jgi:uncharacterized protein (TIGR03083 family)
MDPKDHLAHIRADADMVLAAARAAPDAAVPSCPGWDRTALVRHLSDALGWAPVQAEAGCNEAKVFTDAAQPAEGEHALNFFEGVVTHALPAMRAMDMGATFPTALGPKPGIWVPRRMAHETTVHRWDAAGGPIDLAFAVDGIDELLEELGPVAGKRGRLDGRPSTLLLYATDTDDVDWLVTFGPEQITSERNHGPADATVGGTLKRPLSLRVEPTTARRHVRGDRRTRRCHAMGNRSQVLTDED